MGGAYLGGADLRGANLGGAVLRDANLGGSKVRASDVPELLVAIGVEVVS